jgi:hypothetical protein
VNLDTLFESKKAGNHELGTVADGVDGAILDNDALVARQQTLQRRDDVTQIGLVAVVVVQPLRIENVVQSNEVLGLVHGSTPHTAQLLHVCAHTKQKTKMDAQGTDIGSGLAANPEDTQLPLIVELV